jgi:hypothetical protein
MHVKYFMEKLKHNQIHSDWHRTLKEEVQGKANWLSYEMIMKLTYIHTETWKYINL